MMRKYFTLYFLSLLFTTAAFGQEQLLPLQIDGHLHNYYESHKGDFKNQKLEEPMFLPFFDDFNQDSYLPDGSLWMGENVYVNKKFQLFPPDLGVATFDAMNGQGYIHDNASQFAFAADTLTSQPIRLDSIMDPTLRPLLVKDSVYLSFYYQPQGRGNAPEAMDRLSLEFYSPALDQWFTMWSSEGMKLDTFYAHNQTYAQQVFIPLKDSARYFHSGFQFRFHNLASLAGNSQPDWQSNCDQWNIDLVWLDRNRTITDSSYRKIAFVNEPPVMIKRYKQMPYLQYRNDPTNSMKDSIHSILISNLDKVNYTATYSYKISNQSSQDSVYDGGTATVFPFSTNGYVDYIRFRDPRVISFFSIYPAVQQTYTITHIVNDIGLTGIGDTAYRQQVFMNYFAYDDGTAEAGYGMSESKSKAAVQFKLNTKDTLTRVQMYFNPTLTSANENYFYLLVYKSLEPEELIYKKRFKATFTDGMYNFHTFDLDTNIVLANEFYLGFEQITDENLNIGFDYSLDSKEYLYYNIGTGWNQSIFSGSLMMRPEFGVNELTHIPLIRPEQESFSIYPNPVHGSYVHIDYSAEDKSNIELEIFNLTGQLMGKFRYEEQLDISDLKVGIYFIRLIDRANSQIKTQKLIIR
jgi:hypothetical protein